MMPTKTPTNRKDYFHETITKHAINLLKDLELHIVRGAS